MQEDKLAKWFASMLRKQQEESQLPYELGAWEAFSKKRAAKARKNTSYWIGGIAATLALLVAAGSFWLAQEVNTEIPSLSQQMAMEAQALDQKAGPSESIPTEEIETIATQTPKPSGEGALQGDLAQKIKKERTEKADHPGKLKAVDPAMAATLAAKNPSQRDSALAQQLAEAQEKTEANQQSKEVEKLPIRSNLGQALIASKESSVEGKEVLKSSFLEDKAEAKVELPKEPQLTEEEIEEILETPTYTNLALGLSPGFGASQSSRQATSGSSLGLGLMVDRNITGKLILGSGVAVNYLNQASESQVYAQVAGFSSPVTEKNEIAQVQVDIPLYFKYPITRDQSISVQAGFSNLVAFNQTAETQSSYTRQIAVLDATTANASSFTLRSESVNQLSALEVPQNRFYPFATANFGVNIRLFESKKTSYEVMPFYNYPLQEFSGYGEKLGMFGASFKVNFGEVKR